MKSTSFELIFRPFPENVPADDTIKIVITETKSGRVDFNRAYYDGTSWHGSGSMSNVIMWAGLDAMAVLCKAVKEGAEE